MKDLPAEPKYQWGQPVTAALDLYNDGSYPEQPVDALLVRAGDAGEIVQVGAHAETHTVIYLVDFNGKYVVGCLEEELNPV